MWSRRLWRCTARQLQQVAENIESGGTGQPQRHQEIVGWRGVTAFQPAADVDRSNTVCVGCSVDPLSSFLIGAFGQFQETAERLADYGERIVQLVQLLASTGMCIMKSDDCPHSSAPLLWICPRCGGTIRRRQSVVNRSEQLFQRQHNGR